MVLITLRRGASTILTALNGSEVPAFVVTLTVRSPDGALAETLPVILTIVAEFADTDAVIPVPLNATPVAVARFAPEIVAVKVLPWTKLDGLIDIMRIGFPESISNPLNAGDVPLAVVTVSERVPTAAPAVVVTVIGNIVLVPPGAMAAVTPVPLNVTALAVLRFVPTITAGTLTPRCAIAGLIAVIFGMLPKSTMNPFSGPEIR